MATERESCGRCGVSVAVEAANADRDDGERAERDPYGEGRIEVDERELRRLSPGAWLSGIAERIGSVGDRIAWGRR
ncbi:hypothetical protein [Natronococcus jeotgali]|uniref:Uncharacterized protein n=1 Tax=Natronococcus jeotgali DSM 18795 TaxID=1227498 RepID=L9X9Y0_9EURY|nr:hypothetical protein [Natronococcus jeotgali]ELY58549.1 hypothetical protein C492_12060 [Natronococcus jeotgali DSM 18795]